MIARLWFALSLVWGMFVVMLTHWGEINSESAHAALWLALSPLLFGVLVRIIYRYVRSGPGTARRY